MKLLLLAFALFGSAATQGNVIDGLKATTQVAEYETGRPCSDYVGTPDFWVCIGNQGS